MDWDEVSTPLLIDFPRTAHGEGPGAPRRNGYLWRLERGADSIKFVDAQPFVIQEVFTSSTVNRTPELQRGAQAALGRLGDLLPRLWGGKTGRRRL